MSFLGNYKFTNKKHPVQGGMSVMAGIIGLVCLALTVYYTYKEYVTAPARYGLVCFLTVILAMAGIVLGLTAYRKKEAYFFFPLLGILLNSLVLFFNGYIIYAGVMGV